MAYWFHCNKCYLTLSSSNGAKYVLTNCGHIYCDKCLTSGQETCYICRSQCTTIVLSANISPDIQMFFKDPEETAQKITKVREFQNNNCKKLVEHLLSENKMLRNKYETSKDYIKKFMKKYEGLQNDNIRLRNLYKMSVAASPAPGNNSFKRTPSGQSSTASTPATLTSTPANLPRFMWNKTANSSMLDRSISNTQDQGLFATPSNYNATPSAASGASSGARSSMIRGISNGVGFSRPGYARPTGFKQQPSPSSLNLGKLSFASAGRHQPSGSNRAP